jgi:hypothetical protein
MSDDIVDRLTEWVAVGWDAVEQSPEQDASDRTLDADISIAAAEIMALRAQVEHAHAILASEGAAWLVVGSNHERSWRQSLTPAIQSYWDKYGNYFKEANDE